MKNGNMFRHIDHHQTIICYKKRKS